MRCAGLRGALCILVSKHRVSEHVAESGRGLSEGLCGTRHTSLQLACVLLAALCRAVSSCGDTLWLIPAGCSVV